MATFNNNTLYLDIDGTAVDTYFRDFDYTANMNAVEATVGNATWVAKNEGLKDSDMTLTIVYDDAQAATLLPLIEVGTHTITFGPEGNAATKPKHVQSMIITSVSMPITVAKDLVAQSVSMTGAAAPTTDMYNGGVWT